MKELRTNRNVFDLPDDSPHSGLAVCVTTNGIIKNNGLAVMGAGIAKVCASRFPRTQRVLADAIRKNGNHVHDLGTYRNDGFDTRALFHVLSFPTKNHWREDSDLELIKQSAGELMAMLDRLDIKTCWLPAPGCSNGRLSYEGQVKPAIGRILDDRVTVVIRG